MYILVYVYMPLNVDLTISTGFMCGQYVAGEPDISVDSELELTSGARRA